METKVDKRSKAYRDQQAAVKIEVVQAVKEKIEVEAIARTPSQRENASPVRRKERISLSGQRPNFEVFGEIPGYRLYGFVDLDGRLELAQQAGYEFVKPGEVKVGARVVADKDADGRISWHSGTREDGSSYRTYLMKIEQEYWEENQQEIQDQVDSMESQIKAGTINNVESRYIPTGGIKIQH